jgi:hypothetical protein
MSIDHNDLVKREVAARAAIKSAFGTDDDEFDASLFVSHHLEEIEGDYWQTHLGTPEPKPAQVLEILELKSGVCEDSLDFTLPGDVTNYVICVNFNDAGQITSISMES